jgi:hypothetical protein
MLLLFLGLRCLRPFCAVDSGLPLRQGCAGQWVRRTQFRFMITT